MGSERAMKTGAALRLLPLIYLSVGKPLPEEALVLTAHPVVEVLAGLIELGSARDLALLDIREVGVEPGAMLTDSPNGAYESVNHVQPPCLQGLQIYRPGLPRLADYYGIYL